MIYNTTHNNNWYNPSWMFWSDWGRSPRIERAGMDGSHRLAISFLEIISDLIWKTIWGCCTVTWTAYDHHHIVNGMKIKINHYHHQRDNSDRVMIILFHNHQHHHQRDDCERVCAMAKRTYNWLGPWEVNTIHNHNWNIYFNFSSKIIKTSSAPKINCLIQ